MANTEKKTQKVGDRYLPLNILVEVNDEQVDLSAATPTLRIETEDGTPVQAGAAVIVHPTQVFTAEADDDLLTCNNHGVKPDQQIIVANSGGALPTGLVASTRYFAVNVTPNKFQIATVPRGINVNLTTDGTGTNTFYVVGSLQYAWAAADVVSARSLRAWVLWTAGSGLIQTFPDDGHIPIEIQSVGN